MKRVTVTIEFETKKAYLIAGPAGRKGWIQRRWLRAEDSTVAEKTLARAAANFKERQADKAAAEDFANAYHAVTEIVRETAKAVAVRATLDFCDAEKMRDTVVWIPKSLLKNNAAPGWFITRKIFELLDEYREDFSRYGSVLLDSIGVADFDHCYAL